ncbi:MAG: lipopolysaccharide heptosyltransferase II [Planctomycetaceae bacterium]|nr:lipopolysaccharide heptosyltransferase II [Planctomycetaceae bacterium]
MSEEFNRIVVFLPNWVGDVVMASPVLVALRQRYPAAHIAHFGRAAALAAADGAVWSDETIEASRAGGLLGVLRSARRLRRGRFDMALLLPNSFRCALAARLGRIRTRIGYARDGRGWLLSHAMEPFRDADGRFVPLPTIEYYIRLAALAGVTSAPRTMSLGVREPDDHAAAELLAQSGADAARPLVLINPGASFGPSKMWELGRFAAVADALIEQRGAQIIINAAPAERAIAAQVALAMRHEPLLSFAGRDNSLGLLKALAKRCGLVITGDTGVRHIAAAMGTAVVTLFGSTDPVWAQIDYPRERILRVEVPCSPCQRKMCDQPPGPIYHQCMAAISPAMVLEQVLALLDEGATHNSVVRVPEASHQQERL